jgi:hypothetical protein
MGSKLSHQELEAAIIVLDVSRNVHDWPPCPASRAADTPFPDDVALLCGVYGSRTGLATLRSRSLWPGGRAGVCK